MQPNGLACVNTVAAVVQEKQGTIACGEGKMVADRAAFFTRKGKCQDTLRPHGC